MPKRLTDRQVQDFADNGFVTRIPLLSPDEVSEFLAHMQRFEALRPEDIAWAFDIKCNLLFDWVYTMGAHPAALDVAEDLIGPNILNTNCTFRIKEPGSNTNYGWHQDETKILLEPPIVIAFVAFSPVTPENGCLRVIPGSHRNIAPYKMVENPDGQAKRKVARVLEPDPSAAVNIELNPGEACFFSARIVHGSEPNRSTVRRIALLTDYTAAHARQSLGRGSGQLVRGEDHWQHFTREPIPVGSCTPESVKERRRILTENPENPLMGPLVPGEPISFPDEPAEHRSR